MINRLGTTVAAATAASAVSFLVARQASANISAPLVRESMVGEPVPLASTKLAVASEDLAFDCYTLRAIGECTMRAAYRIKNPTAKGERIDAAFATYDASDIRVTIDGAPTATVAVPPSQEGSASGRAINARVGFTLDVAAGDTREVMVTATVPLGRIHQPRGYVQPPAKAWHPWAGMAAEYGSYTLDYLMAPINTWASVGPITITVRHASWWSLRGHLVGETPAAAGALVGGDPQTPAAGALVGGAPQTPAAGARGQAERVEVMWSEKLDGGATISSAKSSGRQRERLAIELTPLPPIIENGGAFLGAGGRPGAHGGFRARVGYEVALRQLAMVSLALESDLQHIMQIVPAIELATPSVLILPSVGVGVGTAIQVRPDVRAGVRVEGSIHWFPLSFLTAVDFFPIPNKAFDPSVVRVSLLGQFSF